MFVMLLLCIPVKFFANARNSNNFAKSISKICSIYGSIKEESCETIAGNILAKFEFGKYDNFDSIKESCIFQCELSRANKQMSKGFK